MGALEDEIIQLIEFRYGTKAAFARKIGISVQTLYSALKSNLASASLPTVMPIAAELHLDPFELANGKLVEIQESQEAFNVPMYGSIAAGRPIESIVADDMFPIPYELHKAYPNAFLLRVKGSSMNRVLPDGCYALIDPCTIIDEPGQPYAVSIGRDEATIKRVRPLANGLKLEPDSDDPTYRPLILDYGDENIGNVSVIGRVVWFCPPSEWQFNE